MLASPSLFCHHQFVEVSFFVTLIADCSTKSFLNLRINLCFVVVTVGYVNTLSIFYEKGQNPSKDKAWTLWVSVKNTNFTPVSKKLGKKLICILCKDIFNRKTYQMLKLRNCIVFWKIYGHIKIDVSNIHQRCWDMFTTVTITSFSISLLESCCLKSNIYHSGLVMLLHIHVHHCIPK